MDRPQVSIPPVSSVVVVVCVDIADKQLQAADVLGVSRHRLLTARNANEVLRSTDVGNRYVVWYTLSL